MNELKDILNKYLPEAAVLSVEKMILANNVQVNITKARRTKLGDYRPPQKRITYHRISINYDLNKYDFLITLLHEFAHLFIWNQFRNKVEPHGKEWSQKYQELLNQYSSPQIFPDEIRMLFTKLEKHPQLAKTELSRALRSYDENKDYHFVEEIPFKTNFHTFDGRCFQKIEKLKKRYKCICLNDRRNYLFHPLTRIVYAGQTS